MSVPRAILALLADEPMHGYRLRQEFERRTGGTWPLNIGQVHTTVARLVRDGLVEPDHRSSAVSGGPADAAAGVGGERPDVERFALTPAGRAEVAVWWSTPVDRGEPAREELVIKLALAVTSPGVDVRDVVQRQRTETMRALHDYTRLKAGAGSEDTDLAWSLVLDRLVFAAEAEIRWLDHVEASLSRRARAVSDPAAATAAERSDAATGAAAGVRR